MATYDASNNSFTLEAGEVDFALPATKPGTADPLPEWGYIIGNALDNTLTGDDQTNELDGGLGADTLIGGGGRDWYVVNDVNDVIIEQENDGGDTVTSTVSYILSANVEFLYLYGETNTAGTGNALANFIAGDASSNILSGEDGNDSLRGGEGADDIRGGLGTDTAHFQSITGVTVDLTTGLGSRGDAEGDVYSGIENISSSYGNDVLIGDAGVNEIYSGWGHDVLDGKAGADILTGGGGNDIYHVDDAGDQVTENQNEVGVDLVYTTISYSLAAYVENLSASGTAALTLSGNTLNNTITGNSAVNILNGNAGNDKLNGGKGADRMVGGTGNDIYYVDHDSDRVYETSSGGTLDRVYTSVSYTLSSYVERLYATGSASVSLTGSRYDNLIYGNAGSNKVNGGYGNDKLYGYNGHDRLYGSSGNDYLYGLNHNDTLSGDHGNDYLNGGAHTDKLYGGVGNDRLYGGTGADTFVFNTRLHKSANVDTLGDFYAPHDTIHLENAIFRKLTKKGGLSSAFFEIGAKASDKNDYIVYDKAKGYLSYDADGSGKGAAILFARLKKGAALTHKDFYVI